jgi:RimJ/RimL family protein N-acetyltransferase
MAFEKIGGQYEGLFRSHTLMSDNFRGNTVCYSILKKEWKEIKTIFYNY